MQLAQEAAHAKMARDLSNEVVNIWKSFGKGKSCKRNFLHSSLVLVFSGNLM